MLTSPRSTRLGSLLLAATVTLGFGPALDEPPTGIPRIDLPDDPRLTPPFEAAGHACGSLPDPAGLACEPGSSDGVRAATTGSAPGPGLTERRRAVTPSWWPDLAPRSDGSLVRVHGFGHVGVVDADGNDVWTRSYVSLLDEWGVTQAEPRVAIIPTGWSSNPAIPASERAFAVADLTGDGVEDVVVSSLVETAPQPRERHTVVSLLDGVDGALRWHADFEGYVTQIVVRDAMILLGVESGPERSGAPGDGAPGSTSSVVGFEVVADETLEVTPRWTVDTGAPWLRWLAAEPVGEAEAAFGATTTGSGLGQVLLVDARSGEVRWNRGTDGYPRILRHDPGRNQLSMVEQADPATGDAYDVALLDAATGEDVARATREEAIPIRSVVADLDADGALEVVVSDVGLSAVNPQLDQGRVVALDGDDLSLRWEHVADETTDGYRGIPYGLTAAGNDVGVVWFVEDGQYVIATLESDVEVLEGTTGTSRWVQRLPAYPFFTAVTNGRLHTATLEQALHGHDVTTGERTLDTPLFSHVHALELHDVDGDGSDELLAGTESGGVFALDPATLDDDPDWRWRVNIGSAVHEIRLADVTVEPGLEIVVVASDAVVVLRRDGSEIRRHSGEGYTWTATLDDLDGDGLDDLLLPTRWLTAWRPADGEVLWRFPDVAGVPETYVSTPAVTSDGTVGVQMVHHTTGRRSTSTRLPNGEATQVRQVVTINGATGTLLASKVLDVQDWTTFLRGGAVVLPTGGGEAFAFPYGQLETDGRPRHVEAVDPATGSVLWDVSIGETSPWSTLVRDDRVLVLRSNDIAVVEDGQSHLTAVGGGQDVAFPQTSDGRTLLATSSFTRTRLHPEEALDQPPTAEQFDLHWEFLLGRLRAAELDGDAGDELVAFRFDWPAYGQVAASRGSGLIAIFTVPSALTVLDVD